MLFARSSYEQSPCMFACQAAPSQNWRYSTLAACTALAEGVPRTDADVVSPMSTPVRGVSSALDDGTPSSPGPQLTQRVDHAKLLQVASACVSELLNWVDGGVERVNLLRATDALKWSALHYAAR